MMALAALLNVFHLNWLIFLQPTQENNGLVSHFYALSIIYLFIIHTSFIFLPCIFAKVHHHNLDFRYKK